jgi:hypothetical protein
MNTSLDAELSYRSSHTATEVVTSHLEPGEKILWSGRPNVELALGHDRQRSRQRALLNTVVMVGILAFMMYQLRETLGVENLQEILDVLLEASLLFVAVPTVVVVAIIILSRVFKLRDRSRLHRYFNSLSYGMTNRRLLIVEGDQVTHEFGPDDLGTLYVNRRTGDCNDLILGVNSRRSSRTQVINKWYWERSHHGFKAIPNIDGMKRRIEGWIRAHRERAGEQVADFIEDSATSGHGISCASTRRIENDQWGLKVNVPEEWQVKTRKRRKPYGTIFLDMERWKEANASGDWNVLHIAGPAHASVEVHLDECEPTMTAESLVNSTLGNMFGGRVSETEKNLSLGRFPGFAVTRRTAIASENDRTGKTGRVALRRLAVFHDGRRQVAVVSTWPEGADTLKLAIEAIAGSIEIAEKR